MPVKRTPPAPIHHPQKDARGNWTQPWLAYFDQLFVEGGTVIQNVEQITELTTIQSQGEASPRDYAPQIEEAATLASLPASIRNYAPLIEDVATIALAGRSQRRHEEDYRSVAVIEPGARIKRLEEDIDELRALLASQQPVITPPRFESYSPTLSGSGSMTLSSLTVITGQYLAWGDAVTVQVRLTVITGGTASTSISMSLPIAAAGSPVSLSAWYAVSSWQGAYAEIIAGTLSLSPINGAAWPLGLVYITLNATYRR